MGQVQSGARSTPPYRPTGGLSMCKKLEFDADGRNGGWQAAIFKPDGQPPGDYLEAQQIARSLNVELEPPDTFPDDPGYGLYHVRLDGDQIVGLDVNEGWGALGEAGGVDVELP